MINAVPLACFLSMIRPPGVQFDNALLQIAPVDKTKCPLVRDSSDVGFQLYTKYNPTVAQELVMGDDEKVMASHMDFHAKTVFFFHAFMEMPEDGSGVLVREAYMLRGDVNVIMVDASQLEAGPWYFTAADNTWYIGRFAAKFIDYLVSRGLDLSKTHLIGHSLGAQAAGVAGAFITSGRVSRITGLDPALPLFAKLPLEQRLDPSDAEFVDVIHTDAGIFGVPQPVGHADFYPNGGISPQPGCELEVVLPQQRFFNKFFCSHWRSYMFYAESVLRPKGFVASTCESWRGYKSGACVISRRGHMGFGAEPTSMIPHGYYTFDLQPVKKQEKQTDIHKYKTHTETYSTYHKDVRKMHSTYYKKTKDTNKYDELKAKDSTHNKIKDKHFTIALKDRKTDLKSYGVDTKDLELKSKDSMYNKIKHKDFTIPLKLRKTDLKSYGVDTKDISTSTQQEAFDTNLDLTEAESDLESTLTRIKLRKNDNNKKEGIIQEKAKTLKKAQPDFTKTSLDSLLDTKEDLYSTDVNPGELLVKTDADSIIAQTSHVKKRQKRFISLFRSEAAQSENLLFRILEFLNKNRKNVLPVFTVMREINTLVKSANGELNHSTKERNNYIGHNPPITPLATYNLELGSDSKVRAFVKRLFGLKVDGDRLSITGK